MFDGSDQFPRRFTRHLRIGIQSYNVANRFQKIEINRFVQSVICARQSA